MKWILTSLLLIGLQAKANLQVYTDYSELIVKYKADHFSNASFASIDAQENIASFTTAELKLPSSSAKLLHKDWYDRSIVMSVKMPHDNFEAEQKTLNNPNVEWAHYNRIYVGDYREGFTANDPKIKDQTHLKQIDAINAWAFQIGQPEVIIAVTDDGFDLSHEDLVDSYYHNPKEIPGNGIDDDQNGYIDDVIGWNFNEGNNNADSDYNNGAHGTHVAGIIAATVNNGKGVAGVAPGLKVMPLKFYGDKYWTSAMVLETYTYATDNGAKIITTSYNVDQMSADPIYKKAVAYAHDRGVLVFNSAGNSGISNPPRSRMETLLLVASVTSHSSDARSDIRSSFSNYGYQVDVSAPGSDILATGRKDTYISMSGTSMATPVAAAVAGLIWSQDSSLTARQVVHTLLASTDNIDQKNSNYVNLLGTGRVNALKSVDNKVDTLRVIVPELESLSQSVFSLKKISVRFLGSPGSVNGDIFIRKMDGNTNQVLTLKLQQEIQLGTNQISYEFNTLTKGNYQLVIPASSFVDPFGRELDGDRNGTPGGDYVVNFQVVR